MASKNEYASGTRYDGRRVWLVNTRTGEYIRLGQRLVEPHGGELSDALLGVQAPHRPGTAGRLYFEPYGPMYYVTNYGLGWVDTPPAQ